METNQKSLWELLWDRDPNGLLVVDTDMNITLVNPAFCDMFCVSRRAVTGQPALRILGDVDEFKQAWEQDEIVRGEKYYEDYKLYARTVLFAMRDQNLIACIYVNLTHEWQQKEEIIRLRKEMISQVNLVVDKQMKMAQEIAGLLGETTAETKVSLLRLMAAVEREVV